MDQQNLLRDRPTRDGLDRLPIPRWTDLLHWVLGRLVCEGTLRVEYANGRVEEYGDGRRPYSSIAFTTAAAERGLVLNPGLKLGECYMDGGFVLREGDIHDLLYIMVNNRQKGRLPAPLHRISRVSGYLRSIRFNDTRRARENVAHHYDLDGRLYDLFLDGERQYSCAYFETADMTLDQAQRAKLRRIGRKLACRPGQRVLDVGSGWGGLALHLAREHGVSVTGITLSEEQLAVARRRAAEEGLDDRVRFELADYRQIDGQFDRIVSVGMLEHVGR